MTMQFENIVAIYEEIFDWTMIRGLRICWERVKKYILSLVNENLQVISFAAKCGLEGVAENAIICDYV